MAVQSVVDSIAASLMLNEAGLQHCVVAAWDKYSLTATRGPGDNLMLIPAPGQTAGLGLLSAQDVELIEDSKIIKMILKQKT